ncbi:MAG: hypothetical protein MJB14_13000, partial [Spirochaetes bacterium]|nr:hypothetical protein [Spirochaetota bacterium]
MIILDDLLARDDDMSYLFKYAIVKTGQATTDSLFNFKAISKLKDDLFTKILKPLLQFTDCYIRIKDFRRLDFCFVYLLKEPTQRGIERKIEENSSKAYNLEGIVDRKTLLKFAQEIEQSNFVQMFKYLKDGSYKLETDEILDKTEVTIQKFLPFKNQNISLSTYELFELFFPNWKDYFRKLIEKTKKEIEVKIQEMKKKKAILNEEIIASKIYWNKDQKRFPLYYEISKKVEMALQEHLAEKFHKSEVEKFFQNRDNFFCMKLTQEEKINELKGTFQGNSYQFFLNNNGLQILENGNTVSMVNEEKLQY